MAAIRIVSILRIVQDKAALAKTISRLIFNYPFTKPPNYQILRPKFS